MLLLGHREEARVAFPCKVEQSVHGAPAGASDEHVAPVDAEGPFVALCAFFCRQRQGFHLDGAYAEALGAYGLYLSVLDELHFGAVEVLLSGVVGPPQVRFVDVEVEGDVSFGIGDVSLERLALSLEVVWCHQQPDFSTGGFGHGQRKTHVAVVVASHDERVLNALLRTVADEDIVPNA